MEMYNYSNKFFIINNVVFEYIVLTLDDMQNYRTSRIATLKTRTDVSNIDIIRSWQYNKFNTEIDTIKLIGLYMVEYYEDVVNYNHELYVNFNVDQIYDTTNTDLYYKQKLRKEKLIEIAKICSTI